MSIVAYTNAYDWTKVYYTSTKKRKEDYLRTLDYFFRYNRGITNVFPKSFLGRFFLGKFIQSTSTLEFVKMFRRFIPEEKIPITIDTFVPFSKFNDFMHWYRKEVGHFPLWCVPYKMGRRYEWISSDFLSKTNDDLYIDLAIYGMKDNGEKNYYKLLEDKLMEIGGQKTLISNNFYSEEDFWKIWNKENYWQVKNITDQNNIFRDLYTKTCKTMRGLE